MARRFKRLAIIFFGAVLLLIFFIFNPLKSRFLGSIQSIFIFSFLYPFQRLAVEAERWADGMISGARYRREIIELQESIEQLTYDKARLSALERENGELRKILQFGKDGGAYKTIAKIFRSGTIFSTEFVINRGSGDRVEVDDLVVAPSGALVGRVTEVFQNSAKVMLVVDPRFRIIAFVQNDSSADVPAVRPEGVVAGAYSTSLKLKFIPQSDKIAVGDLVLARPSLADPGAIFPIGTIKRIETTARDLFQEAAVDPVAHFFDFDTVMIY